MHWQYLYLCAIRCANSKDLQPTIRQHTPHVVATPSIFTLVATLYPQFIPAQVDIDIDIDV